MTSHDIAPMEHITLHDIVQCSSFQKRSPFPPNNSQNQGSSVEHTAFESEKIKCLVTEDRISVLFSFTL